MTHHRALLWAFFFLSGATALFYEILWMRQLILVFGSTTYAVSAVLSAYMTGLALGSFAFGRAADRGRNLVRAYGLLEIGIGLYALVAPALLGSVAPLFLRVWGEGSSPGVPAMLARFAGSLVILLPPTILMGGTLPVLSRVFSAPGTEHAGPVGRLYAVNTFGAVMGTFLAGFVLLPVLGAHRSTLLAAGTNIALGFAALGLSRSRRFEGGTEGGKEPTAQPARPALGAFQSEPQAISPLRPIPSRSLILVVFALSGFAAMLYEVGWNRALALTIGSSVYGFTLMLIAFLSGLALGAAVFARLASRSGAGPRTLALVLAGIGAASWGTSLLLRELPYFLARILALSEGANLALHGAELGLCLLLMFPATFLMGGVFPLVLRLYGGSERHVGRRVGEAYAANTLGTVVGSAAAGFLLLPLLGVRATLLLAVAVDLMIAAVVLAATLRSFFTRFLVVAAGAALAAGFFLASPGWDVLMMNSGVFDMETLPSGFTWNQFLDVAVGKDEVLYYKEGMITSVLVGREGSTGALYLRVGGKVDASTAVDLTHQVLAGQLPLLFHPHPEKVLVIGLASGITVGSVARHQVSRIRVVEVEPAIEGACKEFLAYNGNVLADPRLELVFNDARNDIFQRAETYDVIISQPSNPWMTVASNLFTQEFFRDARKRLAPGGILCQWVQIYSLTPENLRSMLGTFRSVFPHVLVFAVGESTDLIVLGSDSSIPMDYMALQERMSDLPTAMDLARVGVRRPEEILSHVYIATPVLDEYVKGAVLNTDDNALIEFSAPLSIYSETIRANQHEILRHQFRVSSQLTGLPALPEERREVYFQIAEALARDERPRAALDTLASAEEIAIDDRSRHLRNTLEERIARPVEQGPVSREKVY